MPAGKKKQPVKRKGRVPKQQVVVEPIPAVKMPPAFVEAKTRPMIERLQTLQDKIRSKQPITIALRNGADTYFINVMRAVFAAMPFQATFVPADAKSADMYIFSVFDPKKAGPNPPKSLLRVLVLGEAIDASKYEYDVLLGCSGNFMQRRAESPFVYFPFHIASCYERRKLGLRELVNADKGEMVLESRKRNRFCAFMYQHEVPFRTKFFADLSAVKRVDSIGRVARNTTSSNDRELYTKEQTFYDAAVERYRPYRFVICFENSRHPGYVTEKIVNAMLAGCVPIYYGAPDVAELFNPASFIDVSQFPNYAACIAEVIAIDADRKRYETMLAAPWFLPGQISSIDTIVQDFGEILGVHYSSQNAESHHPPQPQASSPAGSRGEEAGPEEKEVGTEEEDGARG